MPSSPVARSKLSDAMPEPASPAQAVLEALGFALFAREKSGALTLLGEAPGWLAELWPHLKSEMRTLPVADASPFLENFLFDAEECWDKGGEARADSGPWIEQNARGEEIELQAMALNANGRKLLLLERLGQLFEAKKAILQRARETVIAHQRLNSEIQKKEILLHCVADEMTSALANIITSLRLIELEDNGPRTKLLLGLATRATQEQQTLIHRILGVFEEELRGVYNSPGYPGGRARWDEVLDRALGSVTRLFDEQKVRLDAAAARTQNVVLSIDPAHLERVLANLFENALERSRSDGAVVVSTQTEPESLLVSFEDGGPLVTPEICEKLFGKFDPGAVATPATGLRLHFCRIVVENNGGEIGCKTLPDGANAFWIRLTRERTSA